MKRLFDKLLEFSKYLATLILIWVVMLVVFDFLDEGVFGGDRLRAFLKQVYPAWDLVDLSFFLTLLGWLIYTIWYLGYRKPKPKRPEYDYFPKDKDKDKE